MFGIFRKNQKQNDSTSKNENKPKFDLDSFQAVINDSFPGIAIFVRDADISDQCMANYVSGTIIRELCFTDASLRVVKLPSEWISTGICFHWNNL